jgi:hypothetical protein
MRFDMFKYTPDLIIDQTKNGVTGFIFINSKETLKYVKYKTDAILILYEYEYQYIFQFYKHFNTNEVTTITFFKKDISKVLLKEWLDHQSTLKYINENFIQIIYNFIKFPDSEIYL